MDTAKRESDYKRALELGYIFALLIIILLSFCFKRFEVSVKTQNRITIDEKFLVEDIPITRQGIPRKRPQRPQIIIPVSEDVVPEDELIEDIDILPFNSKIGRPGEKGGEGVTAEVLPRPIAEVFPAFPKAALESGAEGTVSLHLLIDEMGHVAEVVLLENTTGNLHCVTAAKRAAKRNKFIPAQKSGKNVAMWIVKNYVFKAPK